MRGAVAEVERILRMRAAGCSLREIAIDLGVSRQRIHQILKAHGYDKELARCYKIIQQQTERIVELEAKVAAQAKELDETVEELCAAINKTRDPRRRYTS